MLSHKVRHQNGSLASVCKWPVVAICVCVCLFFGIVIFWFHSGMLLWCFVVGIAVLLRYANAMRGALCGVLRGFVVRMVCGLGMRCVVRK